MFEQLSQLTLSTIRNEIVLFNNDPIAQTLKRYLYEKSYPEILGISRKEICHSSFLAWILDPAASHGLGDFGIRRLLEIIFTSHFPTPEITNNNLIDDFITGNFRVEFASVEREYVFQKNAANTSGRVDILIQLELKIDNTNPKLRIVLENKVLASEGKDQTERYYKHFSSLKDDYQNLFVYLTPISNIVLSALTTPECKNKNFIQINYQSLVDSMLEPALDQPLNNTTQLFIGQYIQSLGQPTMDEKAEKFERGLIMAIGKDERELLKKFWSNNQKIILAALYAFSVDEEQEESDRNIVTAALSSITNNSKDKSRIKLSYKDFESEPFRKSDIGFQTIQLLNKMNLITSENFDSIANDKSCSFKLLKQLKEMTLKEQEYKRYRHNQAPEFEFNGSEFYIARNWGINNIDPFITKFEKMFTGLKYKLVN